ncbi:MAG TPA: BphX family protein [bacterium]|nr:BphX family protein [bacterium]
MDRNRAASYVLWAMAIYTGLLGLLFAAYHPGAAALFREPVRDPRALFGFGVALLTIAGLKAVMAQDPARHRAMVGIILASEAIFALWQLYEWIGHGWTAVAVTGLIDTAFVVLLARYFPRRDLRIAAG